MTKKIPKDDNKEEEVSKGASKNYVPEAKKGESSYKGTPLVEDKTKIGRKRKLVDHLEGEIKKIKPSTFDGEYKTREEVEACLLDINKYF